MKKLLLLITFYFVMLAAAMAQNASRFVDFEQGGGNVRLIAASQPIAVHNADKGCKGIWNTHHVFYRIGISVQ